jgi:hypothetical protein
MKCGDPTIDGLLSADAPVTPVRPGAKTTAVGHLQDLLRGHGFDYLPDPRVPGYAAFGSATGRAIKEYCGMHGLPAGSEPDRTFLLDLVRRPAPKASVAPAYITLVLDTAFTPILKFVWLTTLFETGGAFSKINANSDGCGLSFGILQWSQRAGQLHNVLRECSIREPAEWSRIMASSGAPLLDYTARPNGGLTTSGIAADPNFELTKDPWKSRFEALGVSTIIQSVQLVFAAVAYETELVKLEQYLRPNASQRMAAFLLDLANQFGPGRIKQQYQTLSSGGALESEIFGKMENYFAAQSKPEFRNAVRARRDFFRTTPLLSDFPLTTPENP